MILTMYFMVKIHMTVYNKKHLNIKYFNPNKYIVNPNKYTVSLRLMVQGGLMTWVLNLPMHLINTPVIVLHNKLCSTYS